MQHQPTSVDDHDAVDCLRDLRENVARDEDGPTLRGERAQELPQPPHPLGVEPVGGLVQHQQLGVAEQGRGETEALAHAQREGLHSASGNVVEIDEPEHLGDPARGQSRGQREGSQMVARRSPRMQVGCLQHGADSAPGTLEIGEAAAEDQCLTFGRLGQAEQHAQRRRLPGAVRPEEAGHRPCVQVERQVRDRGHCAESLRQPNRGDDRWHRTNGRAN